jgi:uncharacterized protein (TIGR02421 family)
MNTKNNATLTKEQEIIRSLSNRIVAAQQPIQILDAIKWDDSVMQDFFKHKAKELPKVDEEYYKNRPLPFDPSAKIEEFQIIKRAVIQQLGEFGGISRIMQRMCDEYTKSIFMLQVRGTPAFPILSTDLYGGPEDAFYPGGPKLDDLALLLSRTLEELKGKVLSPMDEKKYSCEEAVAILQDRLALYFTDAPIKVMVSDNIIADASAGADTIKLNKNVFFSERDLRLLEVHEGWVHIGTTLNGLAQPVCTFLSKGSPSSAVTQEGLGVITEIVTFSSYPSRLIKLTNRLTAIDMVAKGANFLDIFLFFQEQGLSEKISYLNCVRVFRGSTPTGKPFTKDLTYCRGFVLIYNYIRLAIQKGLLKHIPALFVGKTYLEDLQVLANLMEEGTVVPPLFLPPPFKDLAALSSWMCFSLFLNKLDLDQFAKSYSQLLL